MINTDILFNVSSYISHVGNRPDGYFSISSDSRSYKEGEIFLAIKGPSFDGFKYAESVINKGCKIIIYESEAGRKVEVIEMSLKFPNVLFVETLNSIKYLQELSVLHLRRWKKNCGGIVIGITGSNGKTTHKEMLFSLLSFVAPEKVACTQGNYNNHIGVPLTLLRISEDHRYAIVEMGTNSSGEIEFLCEIADPDYGIITNIGESHLEFFKSVENVFIEKRSLYDYVSNREYGEKKFFIVNSDDKFLRKLKPHYGVIKYGVSLDDDCSVNFSGSSIRIINNSQKYNVVLENANIVGEHNFKNLACCFLMASLIFPSELENLVKAASKFYPTKNRSQLVSINNKTFFVDAYNANPSSMKASITAFIDYCNEKNICEGDRYFVLGDMNELGNLSETLHSELGLFTQEVKIENIAFIGKFANFYKSGFTKRCDVFLSKADFLKTWNKSVKKYKYFFIKGSRSLQLESLIDIK